MTPKKPKPSVPELDDEMTEADREAAVRDMVARENALAELHAAGPQAPVRPSERGEG